MTETQWFTRSKVRICKAVRKAKRISLRDLKRATHYNRGGFENGISVWHDALEALERERAIKFEYDGATVRFAEYSGWGGRLWVSPVAGNQDK
jgi:hypothetical protein